MKWNEMKWNEIHIIIKIEKEKWKLWYMNQHEVTWWRREKM